jgi:hypothetical protein
MNFKAIELAHPKLYQKAGKQQVEDDGEQVDFHIALLVLTWFSFYSNVRSGSRVGGALLLSTLWDPPIREQGRP